MPKPTEPGYYWLKDGGGWEIVLVDNFLLVSRLYVMGEYPVDHFASDAWGGKITQEPAPDPPPPF